MTSAIDKKRFVDRCNLLLGNLGGERLIDKCYEWRLVTKFGILEVTVCETTLRNRGPGNVFTRFDDAQAATGETDCGRTGKWNHFYGREWTWKDAAEDFAHLLSLILPPV